MPGVKSRLSALLLAALPYVFALFLVLPAVAFAIRGGLTGDQVANESSGKRPAEVRFETYGVNTTTPFEIVGTNTIGTDCGEVAVRNRSAVDVCVWWVDADLGDCSTAGYNCGSISVGNNLWLIETGDDSFTTRYPQDRTATSPTSQWELCLDPASAAAAATDIVYVSCLKN